MQKRFFYCLSLIVLLSSNITAQSALDIKSYKFVKAELKPIFRKSKKDFFTTGHHSTPHSTSNLRIKNTTGYSTNWAGYAAATNLTNPAVHSVSQVKGSWIVPKLSSSSKHTYSSAWVGIDGFTSSTVEQLGTEHDWSNGKQSNYAWFEMYPDYAYFITNFPIRVGDLITASVVYAGNSIFILSMFNHTLQLHTVVPTAYTKSTVAQRSSAEWIMEAPFSGTILPLSHFNKINFFNCTCKINNLSGSINNPKWQNEKLIMVTDSSVPKAIPSGLTCGGKNFNVIWKHE